MPAFKYQTIYSSVIRREAWGSLLCLMLIPLLPIPASFSRLAFVSLFSKYGAAEAAMDKLTAHWKQGRTKTPNFQYNFNAQLTSSCSVDLQADDLVTMNNVAELAHRIELWKTDAFHNWEDEVDCKIRSNVGRCQPCSLSHVDMCTAIAARQ